MKIKREILEYYNSGIETDRLGTDVFQLEAVRTQEIILRYLPTAPSRILDVGGGTGFYSFWLADKGYEICLIDPVPLNIKKAEERATQAKRKPEKISVCEARSLEFEDEYFDSILFLGPLYHLPERKERLQVLQEAKRVLKPEGILFCAAISRYASLIDGFFKRLCLDPDFIGILNRDLLEGQHRNTTDKFMYFTTAYFHRPDQLREEIEESGFSVEKILPVESFGGCIPNFTEYWQDTGFRKLLLETIRKVEDDPSILGMSSHILAVAKKV